MSRCAVRQASRFCRSACRDCSSASLSAVRIGLAANCASARASASSASSSASRLRCASRCAAALGASAAATNPSQRQRSPVLLTSRWPGLAAAPAAARPSALSTSPIWSSRRFSSALPDTCATAASTPPGRAGSPALGIGPAQWSGAPASEEASRSSPSAAPSAVSNPASTLSSSAIAVHRPLAPPLRIRLSVCASASSRLSARFDLLQLRPRRIERRLRLPRRFFGGDRRRFGFRRQRLRRLERRAPARSRHRRRRAARATPSASRCDVGDLLLQPRDARRRIFGAAPGLRPPRLDLRFEIGGDRAPRLPPRAPRACASSAAALAAAKASCLAGGFGFEPRPLVGGDASAPRRSRRAARARARHRQSVCSMRSRQLLRAALRRAALPRPVARRGW